MSKPNNILLSDFINTHKEDFISFELWVVDDLTDFLVSHLNLLASDLSLIVDIDEEDPFASLENNKISLRFNGRLSPPKDDKQGNDLAMDLDKWVEKLKEWFSTNDVKIFFNENLKDIIKFTLFIPALDVPEPVLRENEQETQREQDDQQQADESATPSSDEVDESGSSEEKPEVSDDKEQKESEKPEEKSEETEPKTPEKSEKTKPETDEQSEDTSKKESDDAELKEFEKALGL